MKDIVLETDRLIIRRFQASDLYDFNEYCSVVGVGEQAGWLPHQSLEESKMLLDKFIDNPFQLALVYKSNNKVIGSIALNDKEVSKQLFGDDTKELGYVLSKDYWGQRLMREAVATMIDYAFNELKLDKLAVCHFFQNTQSKSVILNAGFKYVTQNEEYSDILKESRVSDYYILENSKEIVMDEFKLETDRLIIRRFKSSDLHDFHEYCRVPELKGRVSWLPHQSLEESKHYLELFMKSQDDYAIVYKSNNKVIGSIAFLKGLDRTKQLFGDGACELGYVLSKAYWGQRLMGEAVECMINYAFNELRLDKLAVCHFSTNTQSKSVILRAGFEYYTQIEEYIKSLDETKTLVYYVMNNKL